VSYHSNPAWRDRGWYRDPVPAVGSDPPATTPSAPVTTVEDQGSRTGSVVLGIIMILGGLALVIFRPRSYPGGYYHRPYWGYPYGSFGPTIIL
jgi:hypothetical protein